MINCSEFILDDVMAITAIPLADYTSTDGFLSPVLSAFSPAFGASTIVVGTQRAMALGVPVGSLIPIIHKTAKAKDSESDSVAGRLHSVTVDCDVDDRDYAVWNVLRTLEQKEHHLILTLRDGTRTFVHSSVDTYVCTVERGDGKTSLSFKVQNMMGMQLVL